MVHENVLLWLSDLEELKDEGGEGYLWTESRRAAAPSVPKKTETGQRVLKVTPVNYINVAN